MSRSFLELQKKKDGEGWFPKTRNPEVTDLTPAETPLTEEAVDQLEVVTTKAPSLTMADSSVPRAGLMSTGNGKPFTKGNRAARGRRPKLARLGIDMKYLDIKDERYRGCLRRAEYYLARRCRELCVAFGYVSAGVSGILSTAALQLAASKYIHQAASEAAGVDMGKMLKLLELGTKLANGSRQNEISAWELCAKECAATRSRVSEMAPWLDAGGSLSEPGDNSEDVSDSVDVGDDNSDVG
jgi:hypothetical protein